jgi:hypothetical protein
LGYGTVLFDVYFSFLDLDTLTQHIVSLARVFQCSFPNATSVIFSAVHDVSTNTTFPIGLDHPANEDFDRSLCSALLFDERRRLSSGGSPSGGTSVIGRLIVPLSSRPSNYSSIEEWARFLIRRSLQTIELGLMAALDPAVAETATEDAMAFADLLHDFLFAVIGHQLLNDSCIGTGTGQERNCFLEELYKIGSESLRLVTTEIILPLGTPSLQRESSKLNAPLLVGLLVLAFAVIALVGLAIYKKKTIREHTYSRWSKKIVPYGGESDVSKSADVPASHRRDPSSEADVKDDPCSDSPDVACVAAPSEAPRSAPDVHTRPDLVASSEDLENSSEPDELVVSYRNEAQKAEPQRWAAFSNAPYRSPSGKVRSKEATFTRLPPIKPVIRPTVPSPDLAVNSDSANSALRISMPHTEETGSLRV